MGDTATATPAQARATCTAAGEGRTVLHRDLVTDATLLLKAGDVLPAGDWKPLASDFLRHPVTLYFGTGPVWKSSGNELHNGDHVNLEMDTGFTEGDHRSGLYMLRDKHDLGNCRFQYAIKRIGDLDPTKLIHLAILAGC